MVPSVMSLLAMTLVPRNPVGASQRLAMLTTGCASPVAQSPSITAAGQVVSTALPGYTRARPSAMGLWILLKSNGSPWGQRLLFGSLLTFPNPILFIQIVIDFFGPSGPLILFLIGIGLKGK